MVDLKKVIEGMEHCCSSVPRGYHCISSCHYGNKVTMECDYQNMLKDALALLKEQEPVEPVIHPETKYHRMYMTCGACETLLGNGARYCSRCGRMAKRND